MENEWKNLRLIHVLCEKMAFTLGKDKDYNKKLITHVKDRPGHDRRYAINCDKIKSELGWKQSVDFEKGLELTIQWYLKNEKWVERIRSDAYKEWLEKNYGNRL